MVFNNCFPYINLEASKTSTVNDLMYSGAFITFFYSIWGGIYWREVFIREGRLLES